ncbi:hypothetical protein EVAR_81925_1 [Eumeta japonica]|uniref:Uncharacterized protein n=1 Tax=Eumeta variegata TaxID=151549 RepID=A0A4C1UX54_EUMVA|nr:hypothetical protein EVAR_81925_1 [Eumeta japonica]
MADLNRNSEANTKNTLAFLELDVNSEPALDSQVSLRRACTLKVGAKQRKCAHARAVRTRLSVRCANSRISPGDAFGPSVVDVVTTRRRSLAAPSGNGPTCEAYRPSPSISNKILWKNASRKEDDLSPKSLTQHVNLIAGRRCYLVTVWSCRERKAVKTGRLQAETEIGLVYASELHHLQLHCDRYDLTRMTISERSAQSTRKTRQKGVNGDDLAKPAPAPAPPVG